MIQVLFQAAWQHCEVIWRGPLLYNPHFLAEETGRSSQLPKVTQRVIGDWEVQTRESRPSEAGRAKVPGGARLIGAGNRKASRRKLCQSQKEKPTETTEQH